MRTIVIATLALLLIAGCEGEVGSDSGSPSQVLSGSYANMLTKGDFLYIISDSELMTYSIAEPSEPIEIDRQRLDFGVESLFIRGDNLFIGSRTNLYIYESGPNGIPTQLSRTPYANFTGFCSNDPVVTNDSIAYVTLSTTAIIECQRQDLNELRLYNIDDLSNPLLINSVEMVEPKGLGLDNTCLFVCEATDGLKVLDVSDANDIKQTHHFPGFRAFDVIPDDGLLLVVGPDSLYQFDYTDKNNIFKISALQL